MTLSSRTRFNQVRNPGTVAGPNAKCNRIVSTGRIMAIARIEFGARASIKDRPKYCGVTTNALVRELTPCYVQQHPGFNTPSHFFLSLLPSFLSSPPSLFPLPCFLSDVFFLFSMAHSEPLCCVLICSLDRNHWRNVLCENYSLFVLFFFIF